MELCTQYPPSEAPPQDVEAEYTYSKLDTLGREPDEIHKQNRIGNY